MRRVDFTWRRVGTYGFRVVTEVWCGGRVVRMESVANTGSHDSRVSRREVRVPLLSAIPGRSSDSRISLMFPRANGKL